MLRPERMSKVSVTGSRAVMDDVIEAIHDLNLVHLSDYDGAWEGFEPGDPIEGADEASEKLVTVRSLESILDLDGDDAGPSRIVTDDELDEELEAVRTEVNELEDRRSDIEDDLRAVEERLDSMEPFADLGIDLDLLSGYDTVDVAVGEGDADAVRDALEAADGIDAYEVFTADEGDAVAAFAYPAADDALDEALVGVDFALLDVPDAEGTPTDYVEQLRHERQQLESKLESVESELEEVKLDAAGFLLAAEEKLTIDVQKAEAPLNFATTENAFVAEGWIPTDRYTELASALQDAVGDRVEVDELERASYDAHEAHGHGGDHDGAADDHDATTEDEVAADGGTTMADDQPPVVQDNPGPVRPFELLTETINRPRYFEFDPTVVLFLTFPVFFGFMIGDLGYGVLYMAIGYWLYRSFDNEAFRSLGGIALWSGGFTALFGILYGEVFGLHQLGALVWDGSPPMRKGLQPGYVAYAYTWLVASILVGLLHMTLGYVFAFVEEVSHDPVEAVLESGSWVLLFAGVWTWILSTHTSGPKPDFLYTILDGQPFALGFDGFSAAVGLAGLAVGGVGFLLYVAGEIRHFGVPGVLIGLLESLSVLSDALSYTRIAAVLLAKAGMAFVVNLLFFGVFVTETDTGATWHFGIGHMYHAGDTYHGYEVTSVMFEGLVHSGVAGVVGGLLILVIGHLLVLALGITSAGLQAVRLEYVEFFGKFYDGGGEEYEPFGYERQYTAQD